MKKRGRPAGSKNKKVFQYNHSARHHANIFISTFGIDIAEQLVAKILEIIRANKARLNEKYPT